MTYKKNIAIYFIFSVCLIVLGIWLQFALPEEIAGISVAILIGAATGIIATLVSTVLENNHVLKKKVYVFEKHTCHILGSLYSLANTECDEGCENEKLQESVRARVFALIDHFDELLQLGAEMEALLIPLFKKRKLSFILTSLQSVYLFYLYEYTSPKNIQKHAEKSADDIATFEALKAIKYAKRFDPQPILRLIRRSPNNTVKDLVGREEFFNIIFEKELFSEDRRVAGEEYEKSEIQALEKLYRDYDINRVREIVHSMNPGDWSFSSKTVGQRRGLSRLFYRLRMHSGKHNKNEASKKENEK